jgi:hypothetical protein
LIIPCRKPGKTGNFVRNGKKKPHPKNNVRAVLTTVSVGLFHPNSRIIQNITAMHRIETAIFRFKEGFSCSQAILSAFCDQFCGGFLDP